MIQIAKQISVTSHYQFSSQTNLEDLLFFDIETTGFSAEVTSLYLIGCIYYKNDAFHLIQWFADDYQSEKLVLTAFLEFTKEYKTLIHYNGQGFDIPYLQKKCAQYKISYDFTALESLDIYKKLFPYKAILNLANYKQKTIEEYLGIKREDTFSGGDLIHVYGSYLKAKLSGDHDKEKEYLAPLLLHNEDDLQGLVTITEILNLRDVLTLPWVVTKTEQDNDQFILHATLPKYLKNPISFGNNLVTVNGFEDQGIIRVKIYKDELKFFYSNYKDYYYLPKEDMAIHKSVAFYVDKEFRTKAKAANCYSKKTGCFVVQYGERLSPYFKIEYHDKETYIELTDDFLANQAQLNIYANHLVKKLCTK
ncbi:possible elongation subunit of DNA-dependent DNA polymerase [Lachnospiraceae bacterium KM106-2]|nr:possible elongation subunit of DNA-dependent DNA polymerase [Lachnospiraceae bacterium KM106-2]